MQKDKSWLFKDNSEFEHDRNHLLGGIAMKLHIMQKYNTSYAEFMKFCKDAVVSYENRILKTLEKIAQEKEDRIRMLKVESLCSCLKRGAL